MTPTNAIAWGAPYQPQQGTWVNQYGPWLLVAGLALLAYATRGNK